MSCINQEGAKGECRLCCSTRLVTRPPEEPGSHLLPRDRGTWWPCWQNPVLDLLSALQPWNRREVKLPSVSNSSPPPAKHSQLLKMRKSKQRTPLSFKLPVSLITINTAPAQIPALPFAGFKAYLNVPLLPWRFAFRSAHQTHS